MVGACGALRISAATTNLAYVVPFISRRKEGALVIPNESYTMGLHAPAVYETSMFGQFRFAIRVCTTQSLAIGSNICIKKIGKTDSSPTIPKKETRKRVKTSKSTTYQRKYLSTHISYVQEKVNKFEVFTLPNFFFLLNIFFLQTSQFSKPPPPNPKNR